MNVNCFSLILNNLNSKVRIRTKLGTLVNVLIALKYISIMLAEETLKCVL